MENLDYASPFFMDERIRDIGYHFNWLLENIDGLIEDASNVWIDASTDASIDLAIHSDKEYFHYHGWTSSETMKKLSPEKYEESRDSCSDEARDGLPVDHATDAVREFFAIRKEFAESLIPVASKIAELHRRGMEVKKLWDKSGEGKFRDHVYWKSRIDI